MARQRAAPSAGRSISSRTSRPAGCTARWTRARSRAARRSPGASRSASIPPTRRARGIRDGDIVRVFNDRGACLAGAVLDAGVMPGVAVMATGAWFDPADAAGEPERHGNPNVLTLDIGTSRLAQGTERAHRAGRDRALGCAAPVRAFAAGAGRAG